jgi:hypothetical protein
MGRASFSNGESLGAGALSFRKTQFLLKQIKGLKLNHFLR